eukprot:3010794-Rhodomonas_salina.1
MCCFHTKQQSVCVAFILNNKAYVVSTGLVFGLGRPAPDVPRWDRTRVPSLASSPICFAASDQQIRFAFPALIRRSCGSCCSRVHSLSFSSSESFPLPCTPLPSARPPCTLLPASF